MLFVEKRTKIAETRRQRRRSWRSSSHADVDREVVRLRRTDGRRYEPRYSISKRINEADVGSLCYASSDHARPSDKRPRNRVAWFFFTTPWPVHRVPVVQSVGERLVSAAVELKRNYTRTHFSGQDTPKMCYVKFLAFLNMCTATVVIIIQVSRSKKSLTNAIKSQWTRWVQYGRPTNDLDGVFFGVFFFADRHLGAVQPHGDGARGRRNLGRTDHHGVRRHQLDRLGSRKNRSHLVSDF